jgi:dihydroflavonol-4-reductase
MNKALNQKTILVTGASGFIGQNLVGRLLDLGHRVRSIGRSSSLPKHLAALNIEHHPCDITNPEQVDAAVSGCELVFHLAGLVSYRNSDRVRQYAVNVLGTRNVMQACLKSKIKRVIHASSIAALGIPEPGELGSEDIQYNLAGLGLTYCDTKHEAELEVWKSYQNGLDVVILNPGIIFGEGDTHPHHHAIFAAMSKGWLIGVPAGGVTFSDINDVVDAHIKSIERGKSGQRYVVGSANLSFKEAANVFAAVNGKNAKVFEIPGHLLVKLGTLSERLLPCFGINPPLTRQAAWLSQHQIFFSSDKAIRELDFKQTPFEDTIRRTAAYYLGQTPATQYQPQDA